MENSEIKILGNGKFFEDIRRRFREFKEYLNERPHEIEKSPDHPFGGYSRRHGLKDFASRVLTGAFIASLGTIMAVVTINQIGEKLNADTENKFQGFIEVVDDKNRVFRITGDMKLVDERGNEVELNPSTIKSFIDSIKEERDQKNKNETKLKIGK